MTDTLVGRLDLDMPDTIVDLIARSVLEAERRRVGDAQPSAQIETDDDAVTEKVRSWVNSKILAQQGDRYRFQATINRGAIHLNGRPFNLMSLLR